MPKRTLILILVLILVTVGLVWLSVYTIPQQKVPAPKPTVTTTPVYANTTITLSSTPELVSTTSSYTLNADVSTNGNKLMGVQLELTYDPKAITNVDILPGTFFSNPVVLLKKVDQTVGRITYAIALKPNQEPVSGNGTVAVIQFQPVKGSGLTTTSISFLPKSMANDFTQKSSVLKSALGTTIDLSSLNPTGSTSATSPGE